MTSPALRRQNPLPQSESDAAARLSGTATAHFRFKVNGFAARVQGVELRRVLERDSRGAGRWLSSPHLVNSSR
jgi:hypothetical protein